MTLYSAHRHRLKLAGFLLLLLAGCGRSQGEAPAALAEKPKNEADLARTTLTKAECSSLKIRTAPLQRSAVQEYAKLTGWVMARQGNEVTVTAPVPGYVRAPRNRLHLPVPGLRVGPDQELFYLDPVLTQLEQTQLAALKLEVQGDLTKAQERLRIAARELDRQNKLDPNVRRQQDLDRAEAEVKYAEADIRTAKAKLELFAETDSGPVGQLKAILLIAPRPGTVLSVHVSPGQYVQATAPLVTIADLDDPWVRVPVPEKDLPEVSRKPVTVVLGSQGSGTRRTEFAARLVGLVPHVDPASHTADLLYELCPYSNNTIQRQMASAALTNLNGALGLGLFPNAPAPPPLARSFAKDQLVTVSIPLGREREETVVPSSAVFFDTYHHAWVYVEVKSDDAAKHLYERRRVELGPLVDEGQVIRVVDDGQAARPAGSAEERVVTSGAAILYSREFFKPPVPPAQHQATDDDD